MTLLGGSAAVPPIDPMMLVVAALIVGGVVYFLTARPKAAPQTAVFHPIPAQPDPPRVVYDPAVAHLDDAVSLAQSLARRRHEDLMLKRAIRDRIETTDSLTGLARDMGLTFDPTPAPPGPK